MASPVQVKHEPGSGSGDVFNAATDSEAEDIDDDNSDGDDWDAVEDDEFTSLIVMFDVKQLL